MSFLSILHGLFGIAVLLTIAFLFSNNRPAINWRLVASGFGLQFVFAILVLKGGDLAPSFAPFGWPRLAFEWISYGFVRILGFTTLANLSTATIAGIFFG